MGAVVAVMGAQILQLPCRVIFSGFCKVLLVLSAHVFVSAQNVLKITFYCSCNCSIPIMAGQVHKVPMKDNWHSYLFCTNAVAFKMYFWSAREIWSKIFGFVMFVECCFTLQPIKYFEYWHILNDLRNKLKNHSKYLVSSAIEPPLWQGVTQIWVSKITIWKLKIYFAFLTFQHCFFL